MITLSRQRLLLSGGSAARSLGSKPSLLTRRLIRRWIVAGGDLVAVLGAIYLTFALRFEDVTPFEQAAPWLPILLLPVAIRPALNARSGMYGHSWKYVSSPELLLLLATVAIGTVVMLVIYSALALAAVPATAGFPRSFWVLEAMLSAAAMAGVRLVPRVIADVRVSGASEPGNDTGVPTILFGAGAAGAMMARAALRQPSAGVRPVAFLDDDPGKWGQHHAGVPVRGDLSHLRDVVQATGAKTLLITMAAAPGEAIRRAADAAIDIGLEVRTVPSLDEMLHGRLDAQMVRRVKVEDLLRRPPVPPEALAGLAAQLADEVVLVTGAGGSIGSELARQLLELAPRRLVLLDRAEGALYELQRDIEARAGDPAEVGSRVEFRIADIVNRAAIGRIFESVRPTVIFHAAAYKHVPVMEDHPASAVEVNVGGTLALLDAAAEHDVDRFVFVSTDKAVEPESVMGATKRVAELLVAEAGRRVGKPWVSVRFGNVLGSSGSVVPIFQKQLEAGQPLTVTHPDMTRFFMTIPEAVHLILQAAAQARPADLFVLDMGDPVRIIDLAHDLIRLTGHDAKDASITFTGLRPGERLHERLFYEHENVAKTAHPKVLRVQEDESPRSARPAAEVLLGLAEAGYDDDVRRLLMATVRRRESERVASLPQRHRRVSAPRLIPAGTNAVVGPEFGVRAPATQT